MFANRFTAVIDACVLAGALKRNILLSLAEAELFRPRWSDRILDEAAVAIEKILIEAADGAEQRAKRARSAVEQAFPEALVIDYAHIERGLTGLPDPNDCHVVAAAVKAKASIIVTENLCDFPQNVLQPLEIESKTADNFIADTINLKPSLALSAMRRMRQRFKNPAMTADELLIRMEERGLMDTADILRENIESL